MTGLSGSGKSTLASLLTTELGAQGVHVESLDGDEVRKDLSHGLGFDREDRDRNVRRIGLVARMVARSGACAITAAISPYRALREEVRAKTENFIEVYCECPLEVLTTRDPKGLYKRALAGEIKHFTGVDDPYEPPEHPEVHLRTDQLTPNECIEAIVSALEERGLLKGREEAPSLLPPAFGGEVVEARELTQDECERDLRRVEVDAAQAQLIEFVAAGYLSPLSGFMTMRESHKVSKQGALERGTPWWTEPFVLKVIRDETWSEGQTMLLTSGGAVVCEMTVQRIWTDGEASFAAGPINAVRPTGRVTARSIRRRLEEQNASPVVCLFLSQGPNPALLDQLQFAQRVSAPLVLGIAASAEVAWSQALDERAVSFARFFVPERVPLNDERAQAVMATSVGAAKFTTV